MRSDHCHAKLRYILIHVILLVIFNSGIMPRNAASRRNVVCKKAAKASIIKKKKDHAATEELIDMPKRGNSGRPNMKPEVKNEVKKKLVPVTPARPTLSSESDSESERGHGLLSTAKRISRRKTLAVDMNKPILVLRPDDDPQVLLNMTEREHQDFLVLLNSDERFFLDSEPGAETAQGSHLPGLFREDSVSSQVVVTPGVSVSRPRTASRPIPDPLPSPQTKKKKKKEATRTHTLTAPPKGESASLPAAPRTDTTPTRTGGHCRYLEYDADSSDEEFLSTLRRPPPGPTRPLSKKRKRPPSPPDPQEAPLPASPLSCECFEHMVSVLERELEVAKVFLREKVRSELQGPVTEGLLGEGLEVVRHVSEFLQGGKAGAGGALRKAQAIALKAGAVQSRRVSARNASTNKGLAQEGMDGLLAGLGGAGPSGLSFPAPAVHQLLALLLKDSDMGDGGRIPRMGGRVGLGIGTGSPRAAIARSSSTLFSREQLQFLVPEDRAVGLLAKVYAAWPRVGSGATKMETHPAASPPSPGPLLLSKVYMHWLHKRAGRVESLLRCYHNFMMDEWHQEPSMPPLPEDTDINQLREAHRQLHMLRHDLDQARLIMDRVRRREKLKKELVRSAGESFERVMDLVEKFRRAGAAGGGQSLWQELVAATGRYGYSLQVAHEKGEGGDSEEGEGNDSGSCSSRKRKGASEAMLAAEHRRGRGRSKRVEDESAPSGGRAVSAQKRDTTRGRRSDSVFDFHSSSSERGEGGEDDLSSENGVAGGLEEDDSDMSVAHSRESCSDSSLCADTEHYDSSEPTPSRMSRRLRSGPVLRISRHSAASTRSGGRKTTAALLQDGHMSPSDAATAARAKRTAHADVASAHHVRTRSFRGSRRTTYSPQLCSLMSINSLVDRVAGFHD